MFAFVKKILFAVVLAVLVLFAYQNLEPLSQTIRFQFDLYAPGWQVATPEFPVVFLLIVFFLVGVFASGFHGVYERLARRGEIRRRDRRIRDLEGEAETLRSRLGELRPVPSPASQPPDEAGGKPEPEGTPEVPSTAVTIPAPKGARPPLEDEPTL